MHFDKTGQSVTDLGVVDFLSKEPARVAAAVPKCFYFQEDHWRGSLTPGGPALYEFTGHYFFNKATGDGGVWVTDFTVAGQTFDPRMLPGFPPEWDSSSGPAPAGSSPTTTSRPTRNAPRARPESQAHRVSALTRRQALQRAGATGLGALVASALPFATHPPPAYATNVSLTDATLQAFADTILPGRRATRTDLGNSIHPLAIAGVDAAPGAVETDALALFHHPEVGFNALAPAFLGELETRSLLHGRRLPQPWLRRPGGDLLGRP